MYVVPIDENIHLPSRFACPLTNSPNKSKTQAYHTPPIMKLLVSVAVLLVMMMIAKVEDRFERKQRDSE